MSIPFNPPIFSPPNELEVITVKRAQLVFDVVLGFLLII